MKLANAVKLLSQYGEVNQDESGARIKIDGLEPAELGNISDRELGFLRSSIEMMADYLDSLGFDFRGHKEEVLMPIYEELERRQK